MSSALSSFARETLAVETVEAVAFACLGADAGVVVCGGDLRGVALVLAGRAAGGLGGAGRGVRVVVVRIRDGRISDWKGGVKDWVILEPGTEGNGAVPLTNGGS